MHDYFDDHRGAPAAINSDADAVYPGTRSQDAPPAGPAAAQRDEAADQVSAELPWKLHPSAPQRGPLSLHRAELLEINEQYANAVANLQRCQEPPRRLHELIAGLRASEQNLISLQNEHDGEVGSYIANGCRGDRPRPPRKLVEAELALAQAGEDSRGARAALPQLESAVTQAARLVGELTAQREVALRDAVLEAIANHLDTHYLPHMQAARGAEKDAWDIADALTEANDPQTAQRVTELIRGAKSRLSMPKPEPGRGARFLAELVRHPASAQLGDDA